MSSEWDSKLREQGYRITPQRQLVLRAVEELQHATPEEILTEVQKTASGVNLSTVYRTLEVLEEVGLVSHAHLGHGAPTYHARSEHIHVHLVCSQCGEVKGVDAEVAVGMVAGLQQLHGFETDLSHLALQGRCAVCAQI